MKIAPSILGCDFAHLYDEIQSVRTCDCVHVDVMDGCFVPNISIGLPVVESLDRATDLPLDVHLMIDRPERYIPQFIKAGADILTFHLEATDCADACAEMVTSSGRVAGISIKPNTPAEAIFPYLDKIGLVLVMTVEPGFGGQKLIPECLAKARAIKDEILRRGLDVVVEADGGIGPDNMDDVKAAGVDLAVVGSALFKAPDRLKMIENLR